VSCGTSNKVSNARTVEVVKLLNEQEFEIISDFANPTISNALTQLSGSNLLGYGNNASSINLTGNSNFLKVYKDSVSAFLPYYGERRFGGGYGDTDTGIIFKGKPEDFNVTDTKKNNGKEYSFNIDGENNENYKLNITVYNTGKSIINVYSAQRTTISYSGTVKPLEE